MSSGSELEYLLKHAIPDALDPIIRRAVGTVIPRVGEEGRYRIAHTGGFSSRIAGDLLAFFRNQRLDGALIVLDIDVARAIYFRAGRVVGAASDCLFERLGRVLRHGEFLDAETADALTAIEEAGGLSAAVASAPPDRVQWAVEARVWDIVAALFLIHGGHFVIVEGAPDLGTVPELDLSPTDLALEGLRRYDEWRNGKRPADPRTPRRPPEPRLPEPRPLEPRVLGSKPAAVPPIVVPRIVAQSYGERARAYTT